MNSTLVLMKSKFYRLLIPAGIILVAISALLAISGLSLASPSSESRLIVYLPLIHNIGGPAVHSIDFPLRQTGIKVFASQSSQVALQPSGSDWPAAPTSLPGLNNQKTLTLKQMADIIAYLLNINQPK